MNLQLHPKLYRSGLCLSLSQPTGVWAARDELRSIIKNTDVETNRNRGTDTERRI